MGPSSCIITPFSEILFAHNQQNYTRMAPVYLSEMYALQERLGNFSVNKISVPFSPIGADHGIEHENLTMEVREVYTDWHITHRH